MHMKRKGIHVGRIGAIFRQRLEEVCSFVEGALWLAVLQLVADGLERRFGRHGGGADGSELSAAALVVRIVGSVSENREGVGGRQQQR